MNDKEGIMAQPENHNALLNSEYSESQEFRHHYNGCDLCNPSTRLHRYLIFIFMCLLPFGSYFCYDNPAALQKHIMEDMNVTDADYANLYSWYSYPNVILCFFGGFFIDSVFGIRMGTIVFAGFTCLGQIIFAGGALINHFWVMVFGRFIFGIGGESLTVAQNTYAVLWFRDKELNTVFGLLLSIARAGSLVNFNAMVPVYNEVMKHFKGHEALGVTLMLAGVLCIFSLICAIILAAFDKRAERILNRAAHGTGETVNIKDVLYFPVQFWLLCLVCVTYYVSIFPFISFGSCYLQTKYKFSEAKANEITSFPYLVSAIISPLCGLICDVFGLNLFWTLIATVLSFACHLVFSFAPMDISPLLPYFVMTTLGFMFSFFACAFWPMVAIVIPEHQLGTAYGVMQAIQNVGLAVVTQLVGVIKDHGGYDWVEFFFLGWLSLAIASCIVLQIYNKAIKGGLNPPLYRERFRCCRQNEDEVPLVD
ncbi:major facilitator superfamily domain-containing protein 1-like isoform X2 [Varroa jacobsoni]|uniref:major facilitator superfamily domain-containing protein 1-like isoform X2 n=1 Tax=Varroa jacobsoni TaxID=62625 RepID=UPI000BF505DD|nr:major facilitator superfamily domain-containing protein 1-like isoform X2 [Varroa jacobsoni]